MITLLRNRINNKKALTLVEAIVSITVLGVALVAIMQLYSVVVKLNAVTGSGYDNVAAISLAQGQTEILKTWSVLKDTSYPTKTRWEAFAGSSVDCQLTALTGDSGNTRYINGIGYTVVTTVTSLSNDFIEAVVDVQWTAGNKTYKLSDKNKSIIAVYKKAL